MLGTEYPAEFVKEGPAGEAGPACTALVPITEPARWANRLPRRALPDSTFVTQLIATSEHFPQASSLRRGEVSDALSAYRGVPSVQRAGLRTRQSI